MKEEEIRKRDVFDRYLKLVEQDVTGFFNFNSFVQANCPACEGETFTEEFVKSGFKYVSCKTCATLFVNPRPGFEVLGEFYSKSESTSFWINEFFKPVAEIRREKVYKPRAEYISNIITNKKNNVIGDVGAGFGLFLEELKKLLPNNHFIAIEPSGEMADICRAKGLNVKDVYLENVRGMENSFDYLTVFELTEHLFDPGIFFKYIFNLLKPEGYILLTTLNVHGFDIQTLWEESKSIFPPHHLNFFNPESISSLLKSSGFEIKEIATPGQLDVDIVEGMVKNEGFDAGRFCDLLINEGSSKTKNELQAWISKNLYSSHMRILAQKH